MKPDPLTVLSMWVIYENPSDYPGKFVAREWRISAGNQEAMPVPIITDTLEEVRTAVCFASPMALTRLERYAEDDPKIVEVWI